VQSGGDKSRELTAAAVDFVSQEGTSGFLHACQFDELDTIQYLWPLQQKYPQTLRNAEGQTPLMIAAIFGNLETMKFFCDEKCDLEEVDEVSILH
jgi:ankyrin repeat protein